MNKIIIDLNGDHIDILEGTPTALEFARIVQISRPVLIKSHLKTHSPSLETDMAICPRIPGIQLQMVERLSDQQDGLPPNICGCHSQWVRVSTFSSCTNPTNTRKRRADAITLGPNGKLYFAEPAVEKMTMKSLLDNLSDDKASDGDGAVCARLPLRTFPAHSTRQAAEKYYLQSQNGNVYSSRFFNGQDDSSEFETLRQDIPSDVKWCTEALGWSNLS